MIYMDKMDDTPPCNFYFLYIVSHICLALCYILDQATHNEILVTYKLNIKVL